MKDLEQEFVAGTAALPQYQQPGAVALAQEDEVIAQTERAALDVQAEKAWRDSGIDVPYDYKSAFASGQTNFKDQPLPNQHIPRDTVNVAGYDLATGDMRRTTIEDIRGFAKQGVQDLKNSSTVRKYGMAPEAPPKDAAAIAKIASAYLREGKSYDDFNKGVPPEWSEPHRKAGWNAALNAKNTRELAATLERNGGQMYVKPAELHYEETMASPEFASSGRQIYKTYVGEVFTGTDIQASEWLSKHLRWFDLNFTAQAQITAHAARADGATLKAYSQALEMWDRTAMEKDFLAQAGNAGRTIFDLPNLVGMGIGKTTLVSAGRVAFKDFLKRAGAGAAVGAPAGAASELSRGQVSGKDVSLGQVAMGAGAAAATAGVFSAALPEALVAGRQLLNTVHTNFAKDTFMPAGSPRSQLGQVGADVGITPLPGLLKDAGGAPRVFYHGTPKSGLSAADLRPDNNGLIYFSEKKSVARDYRYGVNLGLSEDETKGGKILKVHLSALKIKRGIDDVDLTTQEPEFWAALRSQGYDAAENASGDEIVVFSKNQIQEASRTRGDIKEELADVKERLTDKSLSEKSLAYLRQGAEELSKELKTIGKPAPAVIEAPAFDPKTGFYSPQVRAIEAIKQEKMTVEQAKKALSGPDVHVEEQQWMDFDRLFEGRKTITKTELLEYAQANRMPLGTKWERSASQEELENKLAYSDDDFNNMLTERDGTREEIDAVALAMLKRRMALSDNEMQPISGLDPRAAKDPVYNELAEDMRTWRRRLSDVNEEIGFVLDEVYGDRLPTLPYGDMTVGEHGMTEASGYRQMILYNTQSERMANEIHPGGTEPGTIGWARVTDRRAMSGEKTMTGMDIVGEKKALFAEELQADIHSDLRKAKNRWEILQGPMVDVRSYEQMRWDEYLKRGGDKLPKNWNDTTKNQRQDMNEQLALQGPFNAKFAEVLVPLIPDELLSKNYQPVLLKRLLFEAAKEGKDYLAWTTSDQQAKIYSKGPVMARTIVIDPSGKVWAKNATGDYDNLARNNADTLTREDVAKKLDAAGYGAQAKLVREWTRARAGSPDLTVTLPKDLELLPQGYKFYDKAIVIEMNKFLKRYGAKVEKIDLEGGATRSNAVKITPEMRQKILRGGVPLAMREAQNATA